MAITLYDLAGADENRRFSPYLLAHEDGTRAQRPRRHDDSVAFHR